MEDPVSTCVQEILEFAPAHKPLLVTKLPLEFAAEADKLLTLKLEGSVG